MTTKRTLAARTRQRRQWGRSIRSQRELLKMSRRQLADALGVSEQTVGFWERGEVAPNWEHQIKLAGVFQVHRDVLFRLELSV